MAKRLAFPLLGVLLAAGSLAVPGMAQAVASKDETPSLWFVELSSPPTADGTSLATVRAEKSAFRTAARRAGLQYTERFAFDTLFNGFSISMKGSELNKLNRIARVKEIYPVGTIARPEPSQNPDPELFTALSMTGADVAQSELGYTGRGVKVAVVDTGIDYDHADLGGDGVIRSNSTLFPTSRVIAGYDFVGDAYDASSNPVRVPDAYPDDCAGHGTHVAGIIGANGVVKGVAPDVKFGAYRVFGCAGSTSADVMIAAMERALADRMQVLNMSIGSSYQWPQYPTAMAATRLVNKGVVVVASIGNSGDYGVYSAGAPGVGEKVIGVASFDNIRIAMKKFTVSPDDAAVLFNEATGAPPAPISGTYPMAQTGSPSSTDDACSALPVGSLAGKVVLIRRGTCQFYTKASNAQNAGAAGVVLYNNTSGRFTATVVGATAITIPVVSITAADGLLISNRIGAGATTMTWSAVPATLPNVTGNLISSFSSYGLSPDLSLKPDLGAPGGYIWSTYPLELGTYASLSGTSMSSPHVAGAAALLLEAQPRTPSQAVRSILQNSAEPHLWWGNPGLGFVDSVNRQGAGMLRIDSAILSTTRVEPGKLSLGESQGGPSIRNLRIENKAVADVTYDLTFENALTTSGTITPGFATSNATVSFSPSSVTVAAGGTATVEATIYPATAPALGQYGGYVVLTPQDGGQVFRVPFAGFVGDYQSVPVMTPAGAGLPLLARLDGSSYVPITGPAAWNFTMEALDIPFFLLHLEHQSRLIRFDVADAVTGRSWHRIYQQGYMGRNSESDSFFAFPWDGMTYNGARQYTVPNGQYLVTISILKALGDPANPGDWEVWTSPAITIARP